MPSSLLVLLIWPIMAMVFSAFVSNGIWLAVSISSTIQYHLPTVSTVI